MRNVFFRIICSPFLQIMRELFVYVAVNFLNNIVIRSTVCAVIVAFSYARTVTIYSLHYILYFIFPTVHSE